MTLSAHPIFLTTVPSTYPSSVHPAVPTIDSSSFILLSINPCQPIQQFTWLVIHSLFRPLSATQPPHTATQLFSANHSAVIQHDLLSEGPTYDRTGVRRTQMNPEVGPSVVAVATASRLDLGLGSKVKEGWELGD